MRNSVLIATDFSKNAWHAINYALELYKYDYCDFYILNVFSTCTNMIDSSSGLNPGIELYEPAKLESKNGLTRVLNMIAAIDPNNPKHHFETISYFGNVVEAIKNIVEEKGIQMVFIGANGKTGSRKAMYGSTAVNIMEEVFNCAVIVVPENALVKLPKEIVFPTNLKALLGKQELSSLMDLARNCKASVEILHVSEEDELDKNQLSNKKLLNENFNGVNNAFHTLSPMEISTAINCFVESRDSDLVAFINNKHIFSENMLTHPLARVFGYHYKVPVLVMHGSSN